MMRELVIILVQAITDLFNCVPKDSRGTERALRIEATLAELRGTLAERQKRGARGSKRLTQHQTEVPSTGDRSTRILLLRSERPPLK